jgi:hypothetical protein
MRLIACFVLLFYNKCFKVKAQTTNTYPRIVEYFSVVHPLVNQDADGTHWNFDGSYTVGFPFGVNVLKSDKTGFSAEVTPFINSGSGSNKVSNILFHPGIMFRYKKGFTFLTRAAFETQGRYGFTLVFNKVIARSKMNNYFIAVPLPVRFGADKPASFGVAFQLGVTF